MIAKFQAAKPTPKILSLSRKKTYNYKLEDINLEMDENDS